MWVQFQAPRSELSRQLISTIGLDIAKLHAKTHGIQTANAINFANVPDTLADVVVRVPTLEQPCSELMTGMHC